MAVEKRRKRKRRRVDGTGTGDVAFFLPLFKMVFVKRKEGRGR